MVRRRTLAGGFVKKECGRGGRRSAGGAPALLHFLFPTLAAVSERHKQASVPALLSTSLSLSLSTVVGGASESTEIGFDAPVQPAAL